MKKTILRIITIPERIRNYILYLIYGFDKWHISPSRNRIYPDTIVKLLSKQMDINSICEIGCGLGDTIARLKAKNIVGLDYDKNVLRAATLLHKLKTYIEFKYFEFPKFALEGKFDVIIAVNWLHESDRNTIKSNFTKYFRNNLNENGLIIVDSIDFKGYKYYHNFSEYFSDCNCTISEIGKYKSGRKLITIRKN